MIIAPIRDLLQSPEMRCERCKVATQELYLALTQTRDRSPLATGRGPRKFPYKVDAPTEILEDVCQHAFTGFGLVEQDGPDGTRVRRLVGESGEWTQRVMSKGIAFSLTDTCNQLTGDWEELMIELVLARQTAVGLGTFQQTICVSRSKQCERIAAAGAPEPAAARKGSANQRSQHDDL